MTHIILNYPVKNICNINLNIDGALERTNDRPRQLEEPGNRKLTQNSLIF